MEHDETRDGFVRAVLDRLDEILRRVKLIQRGDTEIMGQLDALVAQVTQNESVEASAVLLINGIAAKITAAVNAASSLSSADAATLLALPATLSTSATALAAAVAANTPAAA